MKQKIKNKKVLLISIVSVLIIAAVTLAVYAAFVRNAGTVNNTFSPADSILPTIKEEFDGNVKKDVKIEVGKTNYPVYVRAAIIVNWQEAGNDNGPYYFEPPKPEDYELVINDAKWIKYGDYYYYTEPVESDGTTDTLIVSCKPKNPAPDDNYSLSVTITAQTVQAVGRTDNDTQSAVLNAWGYSVTGETTKVPAATTVVPEETVGD